MAKFEYIKPDEIEKRSFEIITKELGEKHIDPLHEPIIKRVIHTTADFEYADTLKISPTAIQKAHEALRSGCGIVTDTSMAMAGINKRILSKLNCKLSCYIAEDYVAKKAVERGVTRAIISMEEAVSDQNNKIFVIGNAPTALIRLYELVKEDKVSSALIIGVPVGFVNVVESKEMIMESGVPYIVSAGRKGGSNVAAAIMNAIQYMMEV